MKLSLKKRAKLYDQLYEVVHQEIVNTRIQLHLPAKEDFILAQTIGKIWQQQKNVIEGLIL